MQEITWQSIVPQFTSMEEEIQNYPSIVAPLSPSKLQARLNNAIQRLVFESHFPHFLFVTAPDAHDYYEIIKNIVIENLPSKDMPLLYADTFDETLLFGAIYPDSQDVTASRKVEGLLHQANGGVLILSLTHLLLSPPSVWIRLKATLSSHRLQWKSAKPNTYCVLPEDDTITTRVIVLGSRMHMADFEHIESDLHTFSEYGEYEQDVYLSKDNIHDYLSFIKYLQVHFNVKPLSPDAVKRLMQAGARLTEDHDRMPLCTLWYQGILREADYQSTGKVIEEADIQRAIDEKTFRASYLPNRALEDIHLGQVFIDTSGEHIGQVNGLTVIEMPGHPTAYGEPARISCVVHFGDGDITDVERKVELAGNIHAKGMMIMQAFISAALDLDEPLPYAASIVFEQSYCEVDGDSASLAELCAFVSALSLQPLKQSIAITGAVDQFGRVQAVGGINEKIEGFYHICAHRGLTGTQGVILPKSNLRALCLSQDVMDAMKEGQFHLWAVENVDEVFPLITDLHFRPIERRPFESRPLENPSLEDLSNEETNENRLKNEEEGALENADCNEISLLEKIAERIDAFHYIEPRHISVMNTLKNWLNPN